MLTVGYRECLDAEVFLPTMNFRNCSTVQKEKGTLYALYLRWHSQMGPLSVLILRNTFIFLKYLFTNVFCIKVRIRTLCIGSSEVSPERFVFSLSCLALALSLSNICNLETSRN